MDICLLHIYIRNHVYVLIYLRSYHLTHFYSLWNMCMHYDNVDNNWESKKEEDEMDRKKFNGSWYTRKKLVNDFNCLLYDTVINRQQKV